jgi:hypothetical protein
MTNKKNEKPSTQNNIKNTKELNTFRAEPKGSTPLILKFDNGHDPQPNPSTSYPNNPLY